MTYLTGPEEHAYDYPTIMVQGTVTGFSHEHAEVKYAFHIDKREVDHDPVRAVALAFAETIDMLARRIQEANGGHK